ncbi:MAG: DUF4118 domain-containing protein [Gammaproteobacteria bacterium]|nr:DUF4118 domain-containing protein [Gammaproteobacteria bacterium]
MAKRYDPSSLWPLAYISALGIVTVTVAVAFIAQRMMPHARRSLLFLTGVLIVAARTGVGPSLLASLLSFLAFNYFLTKPYYTLKVADEADVATLMFFLIIAAITGNLAARMQQEMAKRKLSLHRISSLYEFSRRLSSAAGTEEVLEALAAHLRQSMECTIVVFMADAEGVPRIRASAGAAYDVPQSDIEQAWTGHSSEPMAIGQWTFLPLTTSREPVGMVAIFTPCVGGDRGNYQGTGLGLAICQGMVAAHSGTVTAHEGKQGRGTCMRITLPSLRPGETGDT